MGDSTTLAVHRCRFVDFTPSAITALAFPPLPLPSVKGKSVDVSSQPLKFGTLAVGRANGNIELCEWTGEDHQPQAAQAWVVRKTLSGPFPSKVDSLAFTLRHPKDLRQDDVPSCSDLRLFSSGGGSELIEWDLERGCVRRTISSQGGSIWSIAANPTSSLLALGCEDGSLRLLSLLYDTLTHHRRFDRVKCRLLSIAWGPPVPREATAPRNNVVSDDSSDSDNEEDDWGDSWLVTGGSDSSLRKWDVATGRVLDRMGTDKMRGERTLVWTVGVLGDGTIISGDSLGMVKFWDSRTCTQLQSFQGHGADVLCLTISSDGTTVYTSGVDQKVTQFSHIKTPTAENVSSLHSSPSRWVQSTSRRIHSHDVRALAIWPPYTNLPPNYRRKFRIDIAPILASGGLDMSVVLTPAASATSTTHTKIINPLSTSVVSTFEDSYHRRLAYTSGSSCTSALRIARQARLVCCTRDTGLSVWRILQKQGPLTDDYALEEPAQSGGWERVLDMELNVHTNIIASAISDNGQWLVISDLYETKLFGLDNNNGNLKPRRIRDFSSIIQSHLPKTSTSTGGSAFHFTPDSQKLVMATAMTSHILFIDLGADGQKPRVLRKFDHHRSQNLIGGRLHVTKYKGKQQNKERAKKRAAFKAEQNDQEMDQDTVMMEADGGYETDSALTTVSRMAISADGQWLATTDDLSRTYIFNLDSVQYHCVLPSFHQPAQSLAFEPSNSSLLIIIFPSNSFQIFDVESCDFPEWSKKLVNSLPKRFTHMHDPVMGVTFDSARPKSRRALFWGSTWICKVNMHGPVSQGGFSKKRRRESMKHPAITQPNGDLLSPKVQVSLEEQDLNFKIVTQYRPILLVDFVAPGELVVVERPLIDVLATLPPAYFKPKYGAS